MSLALVCNNGTASIRSRLLPFQLGHYSPRQKRNHDLMVPGDLVALTTCIRWADHHVHAWPIVSDHIQVAGGEICRLRRIEIPRNRKRLEKHLGHYHRAPEIQNNSTMIEGR